MAICCVAVIRGAKKPLAMELTSSMADASGAEPSALMPTHWEDVTDVTEVSNIAAIMLNSFITLVF